MQIILILYGSPLVGMPLAYNKQVIVCHTHIRKYAGKYVGEYVRICVHCLKGGGGVEHYMNLSCCIP